MAPTVSAKNYTLLHDCETNVAPNPVWSGGTPTVVADFYKQGSNCMGFTLKASGNNDTYFPVTQNLTGKTLHMWFMCSALKEMNVYASGGVQIYLYDGTNTGYYYMAGNDTYPGGWLNLVFDCNRTPDSGTQPTLTAITRIGLRINLTGTSKNAQNTWIDHVYVGDGLIAYGTTSFGIDDIYTLDASTSNGWGIIRKINGVYFLVGSLDIGDNSGTTGVTFLDKSKTIIFENRKVAASLYGINAVGNASGTNSITFGEKSGTAGIKGCSIRTAEITQDPKWQFTATDTDVATFQLYGCTFGDYIAFSLPTSNANREVLSCTFEGGHGAIVVSTCTVKYCNVVAPLGIGVSISSTSHAFSDSSIIAAGSGVDFSASGAGYPLANVVFAGCTYDLTFSGTSGTCTVSASGTSNPSGTRQASWRNPDKVWGYDYNAGSGSAYTDETTDAASDYRDDVLPLVDCDEASDCFYIGATSALPLHVAINVSTLGAGTWTITWEYWNSSTWTALSSVSDGTSGFKPTAAGLQKVTFTAPGDEAASAVNSVTAHWIRGRISAFTSKTTAPKVARAWVGVTDQITVTNTKTIRVTVKTSTGSAIQNARVYLKAAAGGPLGEGTVVLTGLTNSSGYLESTTFNYTGDQPVVGWARKSTSSPLYKSGPISDTIMGNWSYTVSLVSDE